MRLILVYWSFGWSVSTNWRQSKALTRFVFTWLQADARQSLDLLDLRRFLESKQNKVVVRLQSLLFLQFESELFHRVCEDFKVVLLEPGHHLGNVQDAFLLQNPIRFDDAVSQIGRHQRKTEHDQIAAVVLQRHVIDAGLRDELVRIHQIKRMYGGFGVGLFEMCGQQRFATAHICDRQQSFVEGGQSLDFLYDHIYQKKRSGQG